jgi:hypothetical protein|tara:strand:+ start:509 stop:850 length:342 start_codon:yes stop_codon:yes gene_type:complete
MGKVIEMINEKEKDVQNAILDWLSFKKIFHYRNNTGAYPSTYKGKTYFTRYGAVGSPDIIAVIGGIFIGIECKGTKGKQSNDQRNFQIQLEEAGGLYCLAHSLDEWIDFFNNL